MIYIGCHLSVTDGYEAMGKTMRRYGGDTFAWFTRNPRGGRTKPVAAEDVEALRALVRQEQFGSLVAHGSYTMNLCSAKEETRANGLDMLRQDLTRMELREIIERVACNEKLGVCFDTCHTWDAGYDLVDDLDGVLQHFDDVIGLDRLKAVHFNDSKNARGSHKDRHEKLGQGFLGMEGMKRIALHPALQGLPFILETPNEADGYIEEIRTVKGWMLQ